MELLVASAVGMMTACGVYLILRKRSFPVIVGLAMLSYAVNVFIFASGRVAIGLPPIITDGAAYTDPLTQALVLTAIVISFGMTALIVMMALGAFLETGDDHIGMEEREAPPLPAKPQEGAE
ncbi:Na+/H+ antiporter subunit C [Pseudorhodobacter sp. E13]|uniref:Na+/H+ antiporter subunit C n=1 Tax=Pseudorhodobacter sp. E13 TaxID=2487931 RepID=UPI000F8CD739|nr:Na+/H+ antiporter subunit C [Pseudorhodobacter sp. E13]RUS58994.1 Na+/H+ antiporter subunit C [Pseudorhodobacter sp. E13]